MPKNILIFSDGTGNAGGLAFDEDRSNVYKVYRATRCGPDSCIDPKQQVAFYDPGLGSPADGGFVWGRAGRWIYNLVSQATGLGLTANIIDCYAALIRLYREGDRIYLFGFSRGAYTVRSLGAVIAKCGIPRRLPGGKPLPLDVAGSRRLATEAVKDVYQFCSSRPRKDVGSYRNFMLDTRELIARRFREEHGSGDPADPAKANVYPYFIGVFDTVAALGRTGAVLVLAAAFVVLIGLVSVAISLLSGLSDVRYIGWLLAYLTLDRIFAVLAAGSVLFGVVAYLKNYLKYDFHIPGYGLWKSIATIHFAPRKHIFTDYSLNVNVGYAKHAISIDENRKDFKRVGWIPDESKATTRDPHGNLYFEQVWFSGIHADVGGAYPENESRLSDITLRRMLAAASIIPDGIRHDRRVLCLYPDAGGPQHDEYKAGHWQYGIRDLPLADKAKGISRAIMHTSVYERFEAKEVVLYDTTGPYRPQNLRCHVDFAHYFDRNRLRPAEPACVADNIELKWERQRTQSAGCGS